MEMCYDGALVMPSSYAMMTEDEMTYVEGGLEYSFLMRSKATCMSYAVSIKLGGGYDNIDLYSLAAEIYAHALMYYDYWYALKIAKATGIEKLGDIHNSIMDGISLQNGLDNRKIAGVPYYVIYNALYAAGPAIF